MQEAVLISYLIGGGFNNALSRLKILQLVEGRGEIRASRNLFEAR